MSPTDPLFWAPGFPKTLYRGRPTTIAGRRFESEQQRVRNADEETRAKAAGWVENEQVAIDAAASAHWAQEDATNRAQWAQQAAATRAQREQQDQARHAADQHHADLIAQAVAKALGRHQAPTSTPNGDERSILGRNIEKFRKECGWTFDEMAIKVGISKDAVNDVINHGASPHAATLKAFADAFSEALKYAITVADLERE